MTALTAPQTIDLTKAEATIFAEFPSLIGGPAGPRGPTGPAGPAGPVGAPGPVTSITADVTYTVGPAGDFLEPGAFTEWIGQRKIYPGVTVTVSVASGTYNCTKQIIGHPDGHRIKWTNAGLNGVALVGADFAALDALWVIDTITGVEDASVAAAKAIAEPIVRAKYKVILQFSGTGGVDPAVRVDGQHSGDWTACPCLFINTGDTNMGLTTGTGADAAGGAGGRAIFSGSCFFYFDTNMICDYGGSITLHNGLVMFATQDNCRNDFVGVIYANNLICIGAANYGYRSNHGGSAYISATYMRGNGIAIEVTNTPGMCWAHLCDIQYNFTGVQCSWGGSAKVYDGKVKNNARYQLTLSTSGVIDARLADLATTATFKDGDQAIWGMYAGVAGSINLASGTVTGHVTDAQVQGSAVFLMLNAIYGTLKAGTIAGNLTPISEILQYAPGTGRPSAGTIEVTGTSIAIPSPAPLTLNVKQPIGLAGTPITINAADLTNMPLGENIAINPVNGLSGESITVVDSSTICLGAPTRVLLNVRDVLVLRRLTAAAVISEQSFNRVNDNLAFDLGSVGTFGIRSPTAKTGNEVVLHWDSVSKEVRTGFAYANFRTRVHTAAGLLVTGTNDDCVIVNKTTPAATIVNINVGANVAGRLMIIKDGRGDAATNTITISAQTGTIDGAANKVINTAYGFMRFVYNGAEWNQI